MKLFNNESGEIILAILIGLGVGAVIAVFGTEYQISRNEQEMAKRNNDPKFKIESVHDNSVQGEKLRGLN